MAHALFRWLTLWFLVLGVPAVAGAQENEPTPDERVASARELFVQGVALVKSAQWTEALVAFERSSALRPHPVTTFNQGACQRALGRYTLARETLQRALDEGKTSGELPEVFATDAAAFLQEIDRILVRLELSVKPRGAKLTVDGRPIVQSAASRRLWLAGIAPPGPGSDVPAEAFEIVLDPGSHVLAFSRPGYADAIVTRTLSPGARERVELALDLLPATISIRSNEPDALVTFAGKDVGPAPVELRRQPGSYQVVVQKDGFEPYEARVELRAGAQATIEAKLAAERVPITKRWWFWTGAAAVVVGGVLATYALTRSDPPPEPYDGGSTGWVATPLRF